MKKTEEANLIYLSEFNNTTVSKTNEFKYSIIEDKKNERYYIFDNFKGILIFTVVFAHFLFDYSNLESNSVCRTIVVFIYCFHMQAFCFISGFLSSNKSIQFINAFKLLIMYYIFNFSFSLIIYFYKNISINFLQPQNSYWYLLSLFSWRISIKYINHVEFICIISIIISLLEGYWDCFSNIFAIGRTIAFYPFFLAGFKMQKKKIFDKFLIWKKGIIKFFVFLFSFVSFSIIVIIFIKHNKITNSALLMIGYDQNNGIKERIAIIIISSMMILLFLLLLPNLNIPILNKYGKNSLYIFLFHRIFTIIAQDNLLFKINYSVCVILFSFLFTFFILILFGSDFINTYCNGILNIIHKSIVEYKLKGKIICLIFYFSFIFLLLIKPISSFYLQIRLKDVGVGGKYHLNFNKYIKDSLKNSIRISYVGDLILLKDQVIVARNNSTGIYQFDEMFQYTSKHFHESDLSIGVYEGPSAGNKTSFSTSNYDDGNPIFLNYPDEFAESVKKAGIDLVTTANNHLLDKNIEGAMRTLDILDKYNIKHIGSYRNQEEKNKIKILNIKGVQIAFLAYTSSVNHNQMEKIYEKYKYLTGIIPYRNNKYYNDIYEDIKNDFIQLKKFSPDITIVLAHMGEQFLHHTIEFQDKWNKIFSDLGADIILGDHSHTVQPLQYIGKSLIINSPGNFANSYIKEDGDSTALIDIFIHKKLKKVICASAIPMYTKELRPKYFTVIPIYDLINNKSILLSQKERERVAEIQLMSTKVLLGRAFGINEVKNNYFFVNNSFYDIDKDNNFCKKLDIYSEKKIYKYLSNSSSITFIGDSLTEGTVNGYHPWFEPLLNCFKKKKINNISKGSFTTKLIIDKFKQDIIKSNSDLYIIAIGTNDIRYRMASLCAMDSKEYINQIDIIVKLAKNINSKYIFIAPWISTPDDMASNLNHTNKKKLMKEFSLELEYYAKINNHIYINPNDYLEQIIISNRNKYMIDYIHPNSNEGIELYCESVFKNSQ